VHAAYLGAILLRELRGGVHIHAVNEAASPLRRRPILQDPFIFKLHGYGEDEVPDVDQRTRIEEAAGRGADDQWVMADVL
jgi:hypothetical protein